MLNFCSFCCFNAVILIWLLDFDNLIFENLSNFSILSFYLELNVFSYISYLEITVRTFFFSFELPLTISASFLLWALYVTLHFLHISWPVMCPKLKMLSRTWMRWSFRVWVRNTVTVVSLPKEVLVWLAENLITKFCFQLILCV